MSEQVGLALSDDRNIQCTFLPQTQQPQGWSVLRNMLITLINEDSQSITDTCPEEGQSSWLATATAMMVASFIATVKKISDREIGLWKMGSLPLSKTDNPLLEWKRCEENRLCPNMASLARRVLAIPATSASPEAKLHIHL
jgi:hypothetical protein